MVRWMCGVLLKDRKRSAHLYSLLGIHYRVWGMGWGMALMTDWGVLGIWSVRVRMIGCRPIERWRRWQGWDVGGGIGRLGENVWMMIWKCLVCGLSGQFSGICGGTSYGQTSNPSLAWKKWSFQNKWWWWWLMTTMKLICFHPFNSVLWN